MDFKKLLLTGIILILYSMTALAQFEYFTVSKNTPLMNMSPSVAVENGKGNFVVVWEQRDSDFNVSVYSAFCVVKAGNKIKVKKPVLLSDAGEKNRNPRIAYDPVSRTFLVVWEKYEIEGTNRATNLIGRRLNRRGKPMGDEFHITQSYEYSDYDPRIYHSGTTGVSPSEYGVYLILWSRSQKDPAKDETESGLYATVMDSTGKFENDPVMTYVSPYTEGHSAQIYLREPILMKMGQWFLPFSIFTWDNKRATYMLEVDQNTRDSKLVKYVDEVLTRSQLVKLSDKLTLLSWVTRDDSQIFHQRMKLNLKKKKKSYAVDSPHTLHALDIVSLDAGGARVFNGDGNTVFHYTVDATGKRQAGTETFSLNHEIEGRFSVYSMKNPGTYLVLTNILHSDDEWELIGYLVTP
jgi:hypothetical protein